MRKISKVLVLVLSAIMVLAMSASVFAASITVQNVLDGETYTAYKILNYEDNGKTGNDRAVSYYLTTAEYRQIGSVLEGAGFEFTASADGTQYYVNNADTIDAAAAAEYLGAHVADLGSALGTKTAVGENGEANFPNLSTGYYFVTSTAGSLCALHEDKQIAKVVEKNTVPTVDKKEKTSGRDFVDGPVDANMGDTVHYQVVVTDGIGTNTAITLTDTMTSGLDYTAGSIKIDGNPVADDADTNNWKITVSARTITIVLKAAYVSTLDTGETVTITYDATINKDAVVDSATGNENKIELAYSKQHSEDKVYVETYDVLLKKTDGSKALSGAKFNVFTQETGGTALKFGSDTTGYYLDTAGTVEIDAGAGTGVNIRGLEPGDYWFEETEAPSGYNKLPARTKVTVTSGATAAAEVTVINEKGTVLPSTGGIGTTIFYIVGSLLVIGCGIVLVSRRRMRDK